MARITGILCQIITAISPAPAPTVGSISAWADASTAWARRPMTMSATLCVNTSWDAVPVEPNLPGPQIRVLEGDQNGTASASTRYDAAEPDSGLHPFRAGQFQRELEPQVGVGTRLHGCRSVLHEFRAAERLRRSVARPRLRQDVLPAASRKAEEPFGWRPCFLSLPLQAESISVRDAGPAAAASDCPFSRDRRPFPPGRRR